MCYKTMDLITKFRDYKLYYPTILTTSILKDIYIAHTELIFYLNIGKSSV